MYALERNTQACLRIGQGRRGRNELRFRRYVCELSRFLESLGNPGLLDFECECGHYMCRSRALIHPDHYRQLRQEPVFILGHQPHPSWTVLSQRDELRIIDGSRLRRYSAVYLAGMLQRLVREKDEENTYVVVTDPDRGYYVQFAVQHEILFCEAVHSRYLVEYKVLTEEQRGALIRLGFTPPGNPKQNWYRTFQPRSRRECVEIAELAIVTLEQIYGMRCGRWPDLTPWWNDKRSESLPGSFAKEEPDE